MAACRIWIIREMKSNRQLHRISGFWEWFQANAGAIANDPENPELVNELDQRVRLLAPELTWEIGPGVSKPWQLVVSPDCQEDFRELARSVVAAAPSLEEWEFYPAKQPKEWDYKFELARESDEETVSIDAGQWTFVLLRYPDGVREILLKGTGLATITDDQRQQAGAIVLENVLGEDIFMDYVDEFEVLNELGPRFVAKERPILTLRAAVMGTTQG